MSVGMRTKSDVVVAGGGTAGVIAAIAAARAGAHTTLVEQNGFVGGVAAVGCMPFLSFHNGRHELIVKGIPWELVTRLKDMGYAFESRNLRLGDPTADGPVKLSQGGVQYIPEGYRFVALEMLKEAGVELMLHSYISDVILEDGAAAGLVVENKSGRSILPAGRIVDCTGDGDVAVRAGAPYEKGRQPDGVMQPLSLFFIMSSVNLDQAKKAEVAIRWPWEAVSEPWRSRYAQYTIKLNRWEEELGRDFPEFEVKPLEFLLFDYGDGVFYAGNRLHIPYLDATDGDQLSQAEVAGRRLAWRIVQFVRKHVPGFENSQVVSTAPFIGIRETRRILGEHYLTLQEALAGTEVEDVVALCGYWPDIHDYRGASKFHLAAEDVSVRGGGSYDIPYRCLVPKNVENLLVAGRCISSSHEANGSLRAMGTGMAVGQAAGLAAALSLQQGVTPRRLDVRVLQSALLEQGAYLGERFTRSNRQ